jgi:hypothetical protein
LCSQYVQFLTRNSFGLDFKMLHRYDQLVLDLTLVGKDIVGAHASRRKQRDNTLVGGGSSKQRRMM